MLCVVSARFSEEYGSYVLPVIASKRISQQEVLSIPYGRGDQQSVIRDQMIKSGTLIVDDEETDQKFQRSKGGQFAKKRKVKK